MKSDVKFQGRAAQLSSFIEALICVLSFMFTWFHRSELNFNLRPFQAITKALLSTMLWVKFYFLWTTTKASWGQWGKMIEMHDLMESFLQIQWSCSSLMSPSYVELRRTLVKRFSFSNLKLLTWTVHEAFSQSTLTKCLRCRRRKLIEK